MLAEARERAQALLAEVGLENMAGTEAYFVSLLADGMEAEAREFATRDVPTTASAVSHQRAVLVAGR